MNGLKAVLIKALLWLFSLLPLTMARAVGRGGARVYWVCGGRGRTVTERNIAAVFPQLDSAQQADLAWRSMAATGELAGELGRVWLRPWRQLQPLLREVRGAELIRTAQGAGRGVVVLSPHLGNWEILGLHVASLGKVVSLYQPSRIAGLAPLLQRGRQRSGARLVPTDRRGIAQLVKNLRGGGIAGILPDQVPGDVQAGENVLFMGLPCFTATLASKLIRRTGALAVFGFAQRVPGGFVLSYQAAPAGIYDDDTQVSLAALNQGVEACLGQCVEQYQWQYKRFRQRPRQRPGLYDDL